MIPQELIRKKRDGGALTSEELHDFMVAYLRDEVTDYHMAAFLMAVFFRGMTFEETVQLCGTYIASGTRVEFGATTGPVVDKHSTGGVGDKTSLLLVPILAAAGVPAPMISGRALGHTGGTLDKLESIPGFRTNLSESEYLSQLVRTGMAMAGQTETLVPLDKRLYALRDVTGTVEVLPLIGASIMSKKIAGGANALVLDVKYGNGAFMKSVEDSKELALLLAHIGEAFGLPTQGWITDMNSPLGRCIGNWLEVRETMDCLRGAQVKDLMEVTYTLAATMLLAGGAATSFDEGWKIAQEMVSSGKAAEKFIELVEAQGGDPTVIEEPHRMPEAKYQITVTAPRSGSVHAVHARRLALTAMELGVGRVRITDSVDPLAGIVLHAHIGDEIREGSPLCTLQSHTRPIDKHLSEDALAAYSIEESEASMPDKILNHFDSTGFHSWIHPPL